MNWENLSDVVDWCKKNITAPLGHPNIGEIKIISLPLGFRVTIAFITDNPILGNTVVRRYDVDPSGKILDTKEQRLL